jgi:hypothetical protein
MADWQIIPDDKDFPKFLADEPQPSRRNSSWRWFLLIGSMALTILIFGLFALQEREKDQVAVRENLTTLIILEESLRLAGNRTQAESLSAPDAPQAWRNAYLNTFENDNLHSATGTIDLSKIDFAGRCAVVEVDINGSVQVRAYCQNYQSWQRAPVPSGVWGYGQTINAREETVRLVLAKALVRRANPASTELPSNLPGVVRFLQAAQTIAALHLMPSLEAWPASNDKGWTATFSPYLPSRKDSFYLMADDIYRQCGLQTLMDIVQRLPNTSSWDDIFQHRLNRSSFILDNEAVSGGVRIDPGTGSKIRDICTIESDSE